MYFTNFHLLIINEWVQWISLGGAVVKDPHYYTAHYTHIGIYSNARCVSFCKVLFVTKKLTHSTTDPHLLLEYMLMLKYITKSQTLAGSGHAFHQVSQ